MYPPWACFSLYLRHEPKLAAEKELVEQPTGGVIIPTGNVMSLVRRIKFTAFG